VKTVTFSGIDGAGKSTQIGALIAWLRQQGLRVSLLTFWDDVVVAPWLREFMSHKAFGGDKGIGSPEKPLSRRDKNVTAWPVTALRFCLYFADAVNTRRKIRSFSKSDTDVVICDRYIYDELANLPLKRWWTRAFVKAMLWIVPKPNVSYVIDADPAAAFSRKPEYPLEFLRKNREAYLAMAHLTRHITVISPLTIQAMELQVREAFVREVPNSNPVLSGAPVLQ
jgi:thymidylate kinase